MLPDGEYAIGKANTSTSKGEEIVRIRVKDGIITNAICKYLSSAMKSYPKVIAKYYLKSGLCAPVDEPLEGYIYWCFKL